MKNRYTMLLIVIFMLLIALSACGRNEEPEQVYDYEMEEPIIEEEEEEYILYIPRITRVEGYFTGGGLRDAPFFWDEAYFASTAFIYHHSLATMSLALAKTTFASPRTDNIVQLLDDIGFDDIVYNDSFINTPEYDSAGVVVGHRYMQADGQSYSLIAVAVRGGNYGLEWVGNVTVGARGYHEGFVRGGVEVLGFLTDYVLSLDDVLEENIKIWITGFSRGAAVASVVAGRISAGQRIGEREVKRENIYAYMFATPRFVPETFNTSDFDHIHHIINPADLVSWVAPAAWGFGRYGVDHVMPAFPTVVDVTRFEGISIFPPSVNFVQGQQPAVAFLHELTKAIANGEINRIFFAEQLEADIQALLSQIIRGELEITQFDGIMEDFMTRFGMQNAPAILRAFLSDGMDGLFDLAADFLFESIDETGIDIQGRDAVRTIVTATLRNNGLDALLTLANNIEIVAHAHDSLIMYEWLQSRDENFDTIAQPTPIQGYRRLIITGAEVTVRYASGQMAENYLFDGLNTWYLPLDRAFILTLDVVRRGNLSMLWQSNCYMYQSYHSHIWETIPVGVGDMYRLIVPAYPDASWLSLPFVARWYVFEVADGQY